MTAFLYLKFELIILLHVISMMLVLLCIWLLLHLKYRGKWGRLGMGMGLCGDGDGVMRGRLGWIESLRVWIGMGTKVRPRAGL